MKKVIKLKESDLENIVKSLIHEKDFSKSYQLNESVVQGRGKDPYQYKKENGKYFVARKGKNVKWILLKNQKMIDVVSKKFSVHDRLRSFFTSDKSHKNDFDVSFKRRGDSNPFQDMSVLAGFKKWARSTFPNVAQLFFARDLTENDFKNSQLQVMVDAIKSAIKRTGKKSGGIEYVDYGKLSDGTDIVTAWFSKGGVGTKDMITNTLLSDPKFMVATTLGRFSYSKEKDKLKITDVYDFKKIPDAKTKPEDLEGLNFLQKVNKIRKDNNVNFYVAIRHLGYLEHPEEGAGEKPKIDIEIPIKPVNS